MFNKGKKKKSPPPHIALCGGGAIDDINLIGDSQADIGNKKQRTDRQRQYGG